MFYFLWFVLQAYQVLKRGGVKEENIIVMVQDDIAHNYMNPHPGKVFNKPNGPNVYEDVPLVRSHFTPCEFFCFCFFDA